MNNNKFPIKINKFINSHGIASENKKTLDKQELKSWYQLSFQKNNRWNRTNLFNQINNYSDQELGKLETCFALLFNTDNQYHRIFIRYVQEYQHQKQIANSILKSPGLKVDQFTYEEIIGYFGDLKRSGKLKNSNKEIAKILKLIFDPDKSLEETTIIDRLMNKKGYY